MRKKSFFPHIFSFMPLFMHLYIYIFFCKLKRVTLGSDYSGSYTLHNFIKFILSGDVTNLYSNIIPVIKTF